MKRLLLAILILCSTAAWAGDMDLGTGMLKDTPLIVDAYGTNNWNGFGMFNLSENVDNYGAFSVATFTAPFSGMFTFQVHMFTSGSTNPTQIIQVYPHFEGTSIPRWTSSFAMASGEYGTCHTGFSKYMTTGQTVSFLGYNSHSFNVEISVTIEGRRSGLSL